MAKKKNPMLLSLPEITACKEAVQYVDESSGSACVLAFFCKAIIGRNDCDISKYLLTVVLNMKLNTAAQAALPFLANSASSAQYCRKCAALKGLNRFAQLCNQIYAVKC